MLVAGAVAFGRGDYPNFIPSASPKKSINNRKFIFLTAHRKINKWQPKTSIQINQRNRESCPNMRIEPDIETTLKE